jgi:nucleotide-binding universal stress UspA family protein
MTTDFFLPLASYPERTPSAGLLRALDIAATLGGTVTGVAYEVDIPQISNVLAELVIDIGALAAQAETESRRRCVDLTDEFSNGARRLGLPASIRRERCRAGAISELVAREARTHDMALLVGDGTAGAVELAKAVLFGSGGPAILFPVNDVAAHLQTVVIAWDGGRAAARALRDAMPILAAARVVRLLTVSDDKPVHHQSTASVERYLTGHGITASRLDLRRGAAPIGRFLQETALGEGAGLMVMGAYGHARWSEMVLGGATRSALDAVRVPTLMSH